MVCSRERAQWKCNWIIERSVYHLIFLKTCLCPVENEIDRESFLLLTDANIFDMVKPIGTRRKLIAKRDELKNSTLKQIGWQKNDTEGESIPSVNEGYQADDEPGPEIYWEDDEEFSLSQYAYEDTDYNYEV